MANIQQIEWRQVVGFEGIYEISTAGQVRSVDRWVVQENRGGPCRQFIRGRVLRNACADGYVVVNLWRDGRPIKRGVHRVLLEAFVGPCPEGMESCHGDGNRANNALSNLRYGTKLENGRDRVLHGTSRPGSSSHLARLSERTVLAIREDAGELSRRQLSAKYSVSVIYLGCILRRKTWRHI